MRILACFVVGVVLAVVFIANNNSSNAVASAPEARAAEIALPAAVVVPVAQQAPALPPIEFQSIQRDIETMHRNNDAVSARVRTHQYYSALLGRVGSVRHLDNGRCFDLAAPAGQKLVTC